MPMEAAIIMVQDITAIATKNTIGMVDTIIRNTMAGITDRIITTADTTDTVIIRIGIKDHTSILILVDIDTALIMDKDVMGANMLRMGSLVLFK